MGECRTNKRTRRMYRQRHNDARSTTTDLIVREEGKIIRR
jgi:hypothetical protein